MTMPTSSWWISTALFFLLGAFGAFFTLKEFGDPEFSDWLRPGPGHPLVGDAGRMLMFEAGPNGIQSLLLGVQANILEGFLLGLGSIGIFASPFRNNLCQFLTCALVPLEAWYYLVNIVYFPLTGAPEAAVIVLIFGGGLQVLCLWRLQSSLFETAPNTSKLVLNLNLVYGTVATVVAMIMVYRAPQFEAEMQMFIHVRDFFMKENNMTWSKGLELPNGFYLTRK